MATQFPTPTELITAEEDENCISIEEARYSIKTKFLCYHQLLDERESGLISELNQLEETNKPELTQVRHDINQLRGVLKSLDESLGANTLKIFLEEQKSILNEQILHFERSEKLLSHVTLKISEIGIESSIKNVISITPFWSKAKFRNELVPFLKIREQIGESHPVSVEWFSEFINSINLQNPKPNDSWEFPVKIPIRTSNIHYIDNNVKMLHSKAWDMLLAFNGLSPVSKDKSNLTSSTKCNPTNPIEHKCIIGHNSGKNKFSFECEIGFFPIESYRDLIQNLSVFWKLFTKHTPILYTFENTYTVSCDPSYTHYTVTKRSDMDYDYLYSPPKRRAPYSIPDKDAVYNMEYVFGKDRPSSSSDSDGISHRVEPLHDMEIAIGTKSKTFLFLIPNTDGSNTFSVSTQV